MTWPGPKTLGRGLVLAAEAPVPDAYASARVLTVDEHTLREPTLLEGLVETLHLAWAGREPTVVRWEVAEDALAVAEREEGPVWKLDASFLFPYERLRFLVFSNNYDGRSGEPKWWWAHKAQRSIGATPGGPADARLEDGTPIWIDGGPRSPLDPIDHPVIHGDTINLGSERPLPPAADIDGTGLAADQLEAVAHHSGSARIIAPAGSGKTRTLAARLRHLLDDRAIEPGTLTAVAYNTRAAEELRDRTGATNRSVRTIHSLGWAILAEAHPGVELIDEAEVRTVLGGLIDVPRRPNADPLGPYVEALDAVRSGLRDPERVEAERDDVPGFAAVFTPYRERLNARSRVDHGEQVYGAIEALLRDPALRRRWQSRCRHLLVDEFQDLTPAYLLLLRLLASPQLQVFGVGDDDQVIYGYAGADPGFLIDFDRFFPGAGHHALATNYRCPGDVVAAATNLLSYNRRRIDKTITPATDRAELRGLSVVTHDGAELAQRAADVVSTWLADGIDAHQIAVLSRVNASLIPVKAALVDRGVATHDVLTASSLRRTTLRALFAWFRIALHPDHIRRADALEAIRRPARGLTGVARDLLRRSTIDLDELIALSAQLADKQGERWGRFVDDLVGAVQVASRNDAPALMREIVDHIGLGSSARTLDAGRTTASRSSHHDDLVAVDRAAAVHPELRDFVPWLREAVARPSRSGAVTLSSVHRVKGREWSRVIVFGADRGAMPHDLSRDVEEERRVFHVAVTRAVDEAVVMADRARPSRFLAELEGSAPRQPEPAPTPAPAHRGATVVVGDDVALWGGYEGTVIGIDGSDVIVQLATGAEMQVPSRDITRVTRARPDAGTPDPELAAALRSWRLATSRRLGVPAYVVFNDRTLDEIAGARPTTERALISVSGIGPRKLEDYGDEILELVAQHLGN